MDDKPFATKAIAIRIVSQRFTENERINYSQSEKNKIIMDCIGLEWFCYLNVTFRVMMKDFEWWRDTKLGSRVLCPMPLVKCEFIKKSYNSFSLACKLSYWWPDVYFIGIIVGFNFEIGKQLLLIKMGLNLKVLIR